MLSEQRLPRYLWVAMAAESIFILAFSVLWRFLLLLPAGESKCCLHRERVTSSVVTSSVVPARDGSERRGAGELGCAQFSQTPEQSSALPWSTACSNIFLLLAALGGFLMLSDLLQNRSCCFHSLRPETHQQRGIACYPIKSVCAKEKP